MAEVLMTNLIVENSFSIATADKCGPLLKNMSPDSQIAKQYQCVKTKTVCVTEQVANTKISYWSSIWNESQPIHFIATCGSNDSYLTKNELFDRKNSWHLFKQSNYITSNLLDLGSTEGASVADMFEQTTIIDKIRYHGICVLLSM